MGFPFFGDRMKKQFTPRLILHGGAGSETGSQKKRLHRIRAICDRVYERLRVGEEALDAVVMAVTLMENSPLFNAGYGAKLQEDGRARLTACLMDGETGRFSSVVNVSGYKNPIWIARDLQSFDHRVLDPSGAEAFALSRGIEPGNPVSPEQVRIWKRKRAGSHGTVGAVALDRHGHLASASSTGGIGNERLGRIGDNCSPSACYCTPAVGVAVTGIGEKITETVLAARIGIRIGDGIQPETAVRKSFEDLERIGGLAGAIVITRSGKMLLHHNTQSMTWAASPWKSTRV